VLWIRICRIHCIWASRDPDPSLFCADLDPK
jgi:hypothetical protein